MSGQAEPRKFRDDTVKLELDNAVTVTAFKEQRKQLDFGQCLTLVNEAILVLEGIYVHLPVKRAIYAIDPVRRLQLLRLRLQRYEGCGNAPDGEPNTGDQQPPQDDLWFHREITDILTSLRDLHTMYVLSKPFDTAVAFVPFQIEGYFVGHERKYLVSNVIDGLPWFSAPENFVRGVEVTHWNDIPIPRAVELVGERNAGGNPDARLARGLARLTIRPLAKALPPDEERVTVRYKAENRTHHCLRAPWRVVVLKDAENLPLDGATVQGRVEALDYESHLIRTLNKHLYSPVYEMPGLKWSRRPERKPVRRDVKGISNIQNVDIEKGMDEYIEAKKFDVARKRYGYIRLHTFKIEDGELFLEVFARLVASLPENGLIIDIRDNPGGHIQIGERLLQLFTPKAIQPETAQFINTPFSLTICNALEAYQQWRDSMRRAVETGTVYSSAYPLTAIEDCNEVGQRYYGPVVLITNGLCYSTADIFAAGFQDHEIGDVLGTDGTTGAGGAEVVTHSWLRASIMKSGSPGCSLNELPAGDLRFAIRRTLRVGKRAGTELEDLGVIPDIHYRMTEDDLLIDNVDLILKAVETLARKPYYRLREVVGSMNCSEDTAFAMVKTLNVARLDVTVDGWSSASQLVEDGVHKVVARLPPTGAAENLELRGFDKASRLVAARKVPLIRSSSGGVQP
jgi:hypothetical protein